MQQVCNGMDGGGLGVGWQQAGMRSGERGQCGVRGAGWSGESGHRAHAPACWGGNQGVQQVCDCRDGLCVGGKGQ